jgi:hypothetical protein
MTDGAGARGRTGRVDGQGRTGSGLAYGVWVWPHLRPRPTARAVVKSIAQNGPLLTGGLTHAGHVSRPLGLEHPGAVWHVTATGNEKREIFRDDADRERWLGLLGKVVVSFGWRLHGYLLQRRVHAGIQPASSAGRPSLSGTVQVDPRREGLASAGAAAVRRAESRPGGARSFAVRVGMEQLPRHRRRNIGPGVARDGLESRAVRRLPASGGAEASRVRR